MNEGVNRFRITAIEKRKLRAQGIRLGEIHHCTLKELQMMLDIPKIRAMELSALSEFQSLPSIGIRFAHDLISLGYYSLKELRGKNPARLLDRLERKLGAWIDPCVEDQFRLVVHYANHPDSAANWWDFTNERKAYRELKGYPSNRPGKAWHELERYQKTNRIAAKGVVTKRALSNQLNLAIKFMKKNYAERITLAQLADVTHLSAFHFLRLFKEVYEITPWHYLRRLRMKVASRLLTKTKRPVSFVTSSCGFIDQSSFTRLFRREFKMTPLAYRKKMMTQSSLADQGHTE